TGDWFDRDPGAVVALFAGSLDEIHLVMFGDLGNGRWKAAPWDPERQGIASWRSDETWRRAAPTGKDQEAWRGAAPTGKEQQAGRAKGPTGNEQEASPGNAQEAADMPCPISLAIRARERFLAHHGAYLSTAGYDSLAVINLVVVLSRGSIVNFDDVAASWDLTDVSVARLDPAEDGMIDDLPLRRIFGAPPEEPLDPFVIKRLKEGSRAAMKLAGPAAA
ncbi:MAG: hypothetical protein Q8P46_15120, partial [Hyphomicrobiales bacterium]|nr:hypothetical protein [Hyphomicrobiales bacterium]